MPSPKTLFPIGFSHHLQGHRLLDDPVGDRLAEDRVRQNLAPVLGRDLGGHDRRLGFAPSMQDRIRFWRWPEPPTSSPFRLPSPSFRLIEPVGTLPSQDSPLQKRGTVLHMPRSCRVNKTFVCLTCFLRQGIPSQLSLFSSLNPV